MRNINVVAKKMARNGFKIANSLGCAFCFESDFRITFRSTRPIRSERPAKIHHDQKEFHFTVKSQAVACFG